MEDISTSAMLDKISNEDALKSKVIPVDFFSRRTNKTTKLINNKFERNYIGGQNRWYDFSLESPIYVRSVVIEVEDYDIYDSVEMKWVDVNSSLEKNDKVKRDKNSSRFIFLIGCFVKGFSFRPDKKYAKTPIIKNITVNGYTEDEFFNLCDVVARIESYKDSIYTESKKYIKEADACKIKISELEEDKKSIVDEINSLNDDYLSLKEDIKAGKEEVDDVNNKISKYNSELSNIKSRIESLEDSIDQKKNEQKALNFNISEKNEELRSLKEDINMFPSEINGFVEQGARSISRYTLLSIVPVLVLVLVTCSLFFNAADLTVIYKTVDGYDLWSILLTRLPFVIISIALIHACYRIAKIFISEIIKINQQRLNLSKISIIATDVSTASSEGLHFDDDALYHFRTKLKMELLREHLKEYISSDYVYSDEAKRFKNIDEDKGIEEEEIRDGE